MKRAASRAVGLVLFLYLLYIAVIFTNQSTLIYPGAGQAMESPPLPEYVERWTLDTPVGQTHALFAAAIDDGAPGVVLLHGNAASAEDKLGTAELYRKYGYSVLIPEYRGYAGASGEPTEEGITSDLAAFTTRFAEHPKVDPDRIAYHGESLGGAVAAALARRRAPRALVLQSTFRSITAMAHQRFAPGFLATDAYDTEGLLRTTDTPALIIHGVDDKTIPVEQGRHNAGVARRAKYIELPGGHGIPIDNASAKTYWRGVFDFLHENGFPEVPRKTED